MKLLLDTHIFLWLIANNRRLSDRYRQAIQNPNNEKYLSVVSVWECTIKYQVGKLNFLSSPETYLPIQRREHLIKSLVVDENSVAQLINLPLLHKDPFDQSLNIEHFGHHSSPIRSKKEWREYLSPTSKRMVNDK